MTAESLLIKGVEQLAITLPELAIARYMQYLQLLEKWNAIHNLTAIRAPEAQIRLHILDALAVLPCINGTPTSLVDVGSGAGIPGLIFAIARPEWSVTLIESNGKKVAFLREVKRVLQLEHVTLQSGRVETFATNMRFDWIVSRALAKIDEFLALTAHLGDDRSTWGLMKAHDDEACQYPGFVKSAVHKISVPFLDAPRLWIEIKRKNEDE